MDTSTTPYDTSAHSAAHKHPPVSEYITVFKWLTGFTIFEILLAIGVHSEMIPLPGAALAIILVGAGLIKAVLVVMYYMHLKFDSRWYTLLLLVGVFFAVLIGAFLPQILLRTTFEVLP